MRKILIGTTKIGEEIAQYYLLAEERKDETEIYGVGVIYAGETVELPRLTTSQRCIMTLLEALIRETVTPVALRDVTEDWLLT